MRYLTYTAITSVIQQFGIYGQLMLTLPELADPVAMVSGFDKRSYYVMLMYIFDLGFGRAGGDPHGVRMALVLGLVILAVSVIQFRVLRANAQ